MREEVKEAFLWLVLVFLVGMVAGRWVIPLFEWQVTTYIGIGTDLNARVCTIVTAETTATPWRESQVEKSHALQCRSEKIFGNMHVQCRCDAD